MNRICNGCGWVHFGVTLQFAEAAILEFNTYFDSLSQEHKDDYYGGKGSSMADYDRCQKCSGPYTDFREVKPNECPRGSTMGPILFDE